MDSKKKQYKKIIKRIEATHECQLKISGNYGRTMSITMQEAFLFQRLLEKELTKI